MIKKRLNMNHVIQDLKNPKRYADTAKRYPTNITELDRLMHGGFNVGIHAIIGAPSQGKSTLGLQIAESISSQGVLVPYFSTEMTSERTSAIAVSRQSFLMNPQKAYSSTDVIEKSCEGDLSPQLISAIDKSADANKNVLMYGCNDWNHTVKQIVRVVKKYKCRKHRDCFVIVDYLNELKQVLDERKAFIDYAISTLKKLSERLQVPILVICAINRDNGYVGRITCDQIKDSGRLEFNFDTIIAIERMDASSANVRSICLDILKQKDGVASVTVRCKYYAAYNHIESEKRVKAPHKNSSSSKLATISDEDLYPFNDPVINIDDAQNHEK